MTSAGTSYVLAVIGTGPDDVPPNVLDPEIFPYTRVNGSVRDVQGAVVSGVTVTLTDAATGRSVSTTTNDEGYFLFPDVRAGNYKVSAEAAGFKKTEVADTL